ncbi:hypothetical protein X770_00825 [Mesorhizobium sp. LSJC269B00]|uniref:hypothetical protein n=1 Tax=Mesorhizobium sp. LSJC269B00 TaxID=1287326 RepID=UPI0003CF37A8|nr:hypothetical protein [Mesorhizobium sp. LSJC269B00]ESW93805.1 hypothetical protein X770_00825 [Mesorhizobium sp. LSJC269B00]
MTVTLLWRFASPDIILPAPSAEEIAAGEKRAEVARQGENAKRRRIKAAGGSVARALFMPSQDR